MARLACWFGFHAPHYGIDKDGLYWECRRCNHLVVAARGVGR